MPWKRCPYCSGLSYSAASTYTSWICPYCSKDITRIPETDPKEITGNLRMEE